MVADLNKTCNQNPLKRPLGNSLKLQFFTLSHQSAALDNCYLSLCIEPATSPDLPWWFFFPRWTEPHQDSYLLQSHKDLSGQAENTSQFIHRSYNHLMFGQFKKMCALFVSPLSFTFPKQEQNELILNFHLPVSRYFQLSIEECRQKARKQHLV